MITIKMDGFEAYKLYLALKSHFTSKTYDFFKYQGKVRAKRESFECRNDKYFFQKLAKHKDLTNFLVSIFVYGHRDLWVGDIARNEESEQLYQKWQRIRQSLTYVFMSDLEKFNEDLVSSFIVEDGQHPHALRLLLSDQIHIETFIIMNDLLRFVPLWNKQMVDKIVWPDVRLKCKKYHPFIEYDREICKKIVVDKFDLKM
jgi:hypothetical protein